jgi:hypothetical protein
MKHYRLYPAINCGKITRLLELADAGELQVEEDDDTVDDNDLEEEQGELSGEAGSHEIEEGFCLGSVGVDEDADVE